MSDKRPNDEERASGAPGPGDPSEPTPGYQQPPGAGSPGVEEAEEPETVHHGILDAKGRRRSPWFWVPSAYFAEGIPYIIVMTLTVIAYKNLGISNELIGLWTSVLYLPWVVKPLWGPLVDKYWTKRNWIIWMQLALGLCFAGVAFGMQMPGGIGAEYPPFFVITLIFLWVIAFLSATHDIACDGFYMLGLSEHQQAWYVGIRSTFYRLAMIAGTGLLPIFAGLVQEKTGLEPLNVPAVAVPPGQAADLSNVQMPKGIMDPNKMHMIADVDVVEVPAGEKVHFYVRLSQPPKEGEEVVVMIHQKGTKDIKIVEGERLTFTAGTWDVPAMVTLSADAKVKQQTQAMLRGVAGNIRLSWFVVFAFCTGLFVLFFFYHGTFLPHPKTDRVEIAERPPFIQPLWWLLVAVVVPMAIGVGIYMGLGKLLHDVFRQFLISISSEDSTLVTKGTGFFFGILRLLILALIVWLIFLPRTVRKTIGSVYDTMSEKSGIGFMDVFVSFFQKKQIGIMIAFLLLYRLGEAQLVKMAAPFLLDTRDNMGLALTVGQVGFVYGTVGILSLTIGGILGGIAVASGGLKKWLWPMAFAINAPDLVYVYMSKVLPTDYLTVNVCVGIEQFGYGFGFTAYMLYMIFVAQGPYKTAHFALTTGFMALGMMLPGMASGFVQGILGYHHFFIAVCLFTIPGFLILPFLPIDPKFGVKEKKKE